jgi:acyl-coenzyme A synthetase/AMP-(fatty) acid ligase
VMWAGGVAVPVNPRVPADEWAAILDAAGFRFILAATDADTPDAYRDRIVPVDAWLTEVAAASPVPVAAVGLETPAFWGHSSGTTGRPKAVVHPHRFAQHSQRVAQEILKVTAADRLFASSKLFFAYPQANSLFAGLRLGATVILDERWPTAANVVETVVAQRPTIFFSVPALYRNLLHEGHGARFAQSGVRHCVSAGEALPASLRDEWVKQTGIPMLNGFGATETLCLVLLDRGGAGGFVPAPGVEVRALHPAHSGPTRVLVRAPTLSLGYWNRPDAQADSFHDGAFCTADLFECTEAGGWKFAGREDSLVKINGRWVNLVELEQRLALASGDILEAAAVAVADADGVATVAFFYVPKPDANGDIPAAIDRVAATLPHFQRPSSLHVLPALPRTATGKLMRRKLQALQ